MKSLAPQQLSVARALPAKQNPRRMAFRLWLLCLVGCLIAVCLAVAAVAGEPPVKPANPGNSDATELDPAKVEFFEKEVRPLLARHCLECHTSGGEAKGNLALDSKAGWQEGGDSGPAIAPGDLDESLLISAVRYESYEMPPKGKLSDAEIAVFEKWVKLGAIDPRAGQAPQVQSKAGMNLEQAREFWSFQLPEAHRPPAVAQDSWPVNDVDRFVLARLQAAKLSPAADADRATWLRRVSYDLTGLPPSPAELAAFLADKSPQAYETVVDRLLASSQFGVHWGRHWLDVARYADSNGSDFNATFFNAWRYRNYVIDAFNNNRPYDQFVREQIAGDLMSYSTDEQRADQLVATTFLTIGPKMLSERDKEKLAMDVVDEQVDSVGRAFLGMTLGCARCHDHKFDPIPTADYYALAGIFKSTVTLEGESQQYVSAWKETPLPISPEHAEALAAYNSAKDRLKGQLANAQKDLKAADARLDQLKSNSRGITVDDREAKLVGQWTSSKFSPNFVGEGYVHDEKQGKGEKSVIWTPNLPQAGRYEVRISYAGGSGRDPAVPVTIVHAGGKTELKLDQTKPGSIDKLFQPLGVFQFEQGTAGSVTISNAGTSGHVLADAVQFLAMDEDASKDAVAKQQSPEVKETEQQIADAKALIARLEKETKDLEKTAPPAAPTAMAAREAQQIDDCQICIRGEIKHRGPKVQRGFLQVASDATVTIENPEQSGRLELAQWLTRPDHPLTARVMVNRVWQHVFGEGLVRTVDNFGHLGQLPSHPQLLDTLAVEFVESGWQIKPLVRKLALSRAYRMSSQFNETAYLADPDNKLLWRANRKRLPAEALRDSLLAISGQLDLAPGDSPVRGLGYLAIGNNNESSSGRNTDIQRRSVYLPIIRNELPAFLTVFDFADPDVVTGRRDTTNVPTQALFLLNDPLVRAQASATAKRLLAEHPQDEAARLDQAYRLVLCRKPTQDERGRAAAFMSSVAADGGKPQEVWQQLVQALLASTEFRMLN